MTLGRLMLFHVAKYQLQTALGSYVDAHSHPFDSLHLGELDSDIADGSFCMV